MADEIYSDSSEKTILARRAFEIQVKSIYGMKDLTSKGKQQKLCEFYATHTADENTLYKRYRCLKFATEQLGQLVLGNIIAALVTIFVSALEIQGTPMIRIAVSITTGLLVLISSYILGRLWLAAYMNKNDLLLCPVEIKLLEKELHIGSHLQI